MKKIDISKIALIFMFLVFIVVCMFLAFNIKLGVSPDSYYHFEVSKAYSTTLVIPQNTPETFKWRDITRIPYLYFWINGRILNINNGIFDEVILLRIVNILYSVGTIYIVYLLSKELFKNKWKRLLPVFFLSHTLMFVFLSSSINYDNLANLFCTLSIYFFVKFIKDSNLKYILLMLLFLCMGALTKSTVLPVALISVILCIVEIIKRKINFKKIKVGKELLLIAPILLFALLNLELYGGNFIKYGKLQPSCTQVLTHEQCLENGVYYRDRIDFQAVPIKGFSETFDMIRDGERVGPVRYLFKWFPDLTGKIFGVMGDSSLYLPSVFKYIFIFFFLTALISAIVNRKKWTKVDRNLMIILLFYICILFFTQNYSMYLTYNNYYLGLQGRYIFPVISIIYVLMAKSFVIIKERRLRYFILFSFILLLMYSCNIFLFLYLPYYWIM